MPILTVGNNSTFRSYATGNLYAHVLAFRVNTQNTIADLLVTDYTSNPEIVGDRIKLPEFTGLDVTPTQILHLSVEINLLKELAEQYQTKFDEEFFDRLDAGLSQTNWVVLHDKFCLANLQVRLQKRATHLTGDVQQAWLLSEQLVEIEQFWDRVLEWCSSHMSQNLSLVSKIVNSLNKDAISRAVVVLGPLVLTSGSTSYSAGESQTQIKTEQSSDEIDLQANFRDLLEPVSQPAQPHRHSQSQTQYLTQLQSLHSQSIPQSQYSDSQNSQPLIESTTYLGEQLTGDKSNDDIFSIETRGALFHTLAQLNRIPLEVNNRIYKTKAYVVGTIPQDLTYLCTKVYEVQEGKICISDPHIEPLELILLDSSEKSLTPQNSLLVLLPKDQLMVFMGLQFHEQLYTRLEKLQSLFKQRELQKITFELTITSDNGIAMWTTRNLDLAALLSKAS